jgi:hypothetical protein
MSFFLFVDESGHDQRESPYEVLAGVAVEDRDIWNLITALHASEVEHFGRRYTLGTRELKGSNLLNRKVFRHAALEPPIQELGRARLAKECLDHGPVARRPELAALAQAKLSYVREALILAARFRCRCFASIIDRNAPRPTADYLRKDYAYLFERFFYFLEDSGEDASGIVVFDELEKSSSHILLNQMHRYFRETAKGRHRSSRIIPEAFFVHSDLTTGIQLADLTAYIVSWGVRLPVMTQPARKELAEHARLVTELRYCATRQINENPGFKIWSFAFIDDLRARIEQPEGY